MKNYKIADVVVSMEPDVRTEKQAKKYLYYGEQEPVFHVCPKTFEEFNSRNDLNMDFQMYEYLTCGISFHVQIIDHNGMYVHSSAVVVDDNAYLFSAPCGTGKSTHTSLWLEKFGDAAYILDDDKPIVRVMDDGIYAYGTPWSGKHDISVDKKVKLQGICFLKRDTTDWIRKLPPKDAAFKIYQNCLWNIPADKIGKYFDVINKIVDKIGVYEMGCTPTVNAVEVSYNNMKPMK